MNSCELYKINTEYKYKPIGYEDIGFTAFYRTRLLRTLCSKSLLTLQCYSGSMLGQTVSINGFTEMIKISSASHSVM